jgi:hypothetical protein
VQSHIKGFAISLNLFKLCQITRQYSDSGALTCQHLLCFRFHETPLKVTYKGYHKYDAKIYLKKSFILYYSCYSYSKNTKTRSQTAMISQAVRDIAATHGFAFYVQGCGYRSLVEITDLAGKHITWTGNKSKSALQAINTLVQQRALDAKTDEEIAVEAPIAHAMIEEVAPVAIAVVEDSWEARHKERFADYTDEDWKLEHSCGSASDRQDERATMSFPSYSYDLMRY